MRNNLGSGDGIQWFGCRLFFALQAVEDFPLNRRLSRSGFNRPGEGNQTEVLAAGQADQSVADSFSTVAADRTFS